ncbi:hypothetical protein DFH08DRAFT_941094 [Mycena albidolilacea]|uniref:Uncharacterized protein n=1 Tax=Mycena albidolilacea TaxID=1033008 RepID=A0AAD7EIK5_9AGAR|nr:hypothetical protein DFH08DRAFT_941094 [Mycena albidolilacea]
MHHLFVLLPPIRDDKEVHLEPLVVHLLTQPLYPTSADNLLAQSPHTNLCTQPPRTSTAPIHHAHPLRISTAPTCLMHILNGFGELVHQFLASHLFQGASQSANRFHHSASVCLLLTSSCTLCLPPTPRRRRCAFVRTLEEHEGDEQREWLKERAHKFREAAEIMEKQAEGGTSLWMSSISRRDVGCDVADMVDDIVRDRASHRPRETTWARAGD